MSIGDIKSIKPVWHLITTDIDLTLQPDRLIEKYTSNGFRIYKSSWTDLHSALEQGYSEIYSDDKLWTKQQDHDKIARILKNWQDRVPLIPPLLIDNGFNKLVPADGKHRLKVTSFLESSEVVFILFDVDLPKIKKYFSPKLIN